MNGEYFQASNIGGAIDLAREIDRVNNLILDNILYSCVLRDSETEEWRPIAKGESPMSFLP